MKSIMFANQKGGVGKSTIALNVISELANINASFLFDCDPQASLVDFLRVRESKELSYNFGIESPTFNSIDFAIKKLKNVDFVVIDTQGSANADIKKVLENISFAVIPMKPSLVDIFASETLISVLPSGLKYRVLLNMVPTNDSSSVVMVKDRLKDLNIPYFENFISDRKIYKESYALGLSVKEYAKLNNATNVKNAIREFDNFINEFLNFIGEKNV